MSDDGHGITEVDICTESVIAAEHLHCFGCFKLDCGQLEPCPVVSCPHCAVRLHKCKLDDHENICFGAPAPCPNAFYGCPVQLRRYLLAAHLAKCPASIVHCPSVRNRQFFNEKSKKLLKKIAKGQMPKLGVEVDEEEMLASDVAFARIDQSILERFFQAKREWRSRLKPAAIGLDGLAGMSLAQTEMDAMAREEDSSDEEKRANERRQKVIREPFAGCRLCRLNPGSQHLHELGSMRMAQAEGAERNGARHSKKAEKGGEEDPLNFLPEFHRKRGLLLQPEVPFTSIISDEHYLHQNYPIFGCSARFVRRDHFSGHYQCHLTLEESSPGSCIGRCPNWQFGCPFRMDVRKPVEGGQIRFNPFLSACVHLPLPQLPVQSRWPSPTSAGFSLDQMPPHFFALLAPHLEDSSLRALSSSCRRLRELLPSLLAHRLAVELVWRRSEEEDGANKFVPSGVRKWFVPVQDGPPRLAVVPQGPVIDHLQECRYSGVRELGKEPIDLRKFHGPHFPIRHHLAPN